MDFSSITDDLFIGTTPFTQNYDQLRGLGVRLVINMRLTHYPKADAYAQPLIFLSLRTVDSPFFPIPIQKLQRGAQMALETIRDGGKVYAHCAGGRHRGVAMGACILVAQGHSPLDAMKLIKDRRSFADPHIYYIRNQILRFALEWQNMVAGFPHPT
jgi:protein-tyrosine phosphatase